MAGLPSARYATGTAVLSSFRQFGPVLGISTLIVVVGNPAPGEIVESFHRAWALMSSGGLAAATVAIGLLRLRPAQRDPTSHRAVAARGPEAQLAKSTA